MPQPITILTAGLFFVVLALRFRGRPKDSRARTNSQRLKLAKLLLGAIVAWLAIHYSLQHTLAKMDGTDTEPSYLERAVTWLHSH